MDINDRVSPRHGKVLLITSARCFCRRFISIMRRIILICLLLARLFCWTVLARVCAERGHIETAGLDVTFRMIFSFCFFYLDYARSMLFALVVIKKKSKDVFCK